MELSPGKQLGPYKILSTLGSGGMGEVYRAQDSRLDRIVALKILPIDVAKDEERMRRFEQEAKAASKLSHPNVAHIYEIGSSENIHFIAMEYIEGLTLDERIKTRQLEITEIIDIGMQVADALDEAHHKGIMHRDIKPANIMIKEKGQVKVLDFGLAKIFRTAGDVAASEVNTLTKTRSGTVFGTVPYMSPEQALGRTLDLRSDIFSLGAVLYEMTTGRLPFSGAGPGEVLDQIIHAQPDAISRFNYNVPPELERIIRKCLEKDADRRYQSARDLYVDLKNLKRDSDAGVVARQLPARALPSSRSIAFAGVALVLTIAIAAGLFWRSASRQTIHSIAVMPFLNIGGNPETEYLGDGITESTINALSQLPQLKVMAPGTVFTYKGKNVDPRKVGRDLKVDTVVTGKIHHRGDMLIIEANLASVEDGSQIWGGHFERTLSDLKTLQSDISNDLTEKLQLKLTGQQKILITKRYTDNSDAYRLYLKGRYFFNKRTEEGINKGIEFFNQAIDKDPNYALAYAGLSEVYGLLGDHAKSKAAVTQALQLDDDLAEAHVSLAFVKTLEWDLDGVEQEFKKAIQLNPNLADAHLQYGDLLAAKGQLEKAVFETKLGQQLDPLNVHVGMNVGAKLFLARRYDEAIEELRKTIEMDPNFAQAHERLSEVYIMKGMYKESIDSYARAGTLFGIKSEVIANAIKTLQKGFNEKGARGYWEAKIELARLRSIRQGTPFPDSLEVAVAYAQLGKKDEAFECLEKAYDQRDLELVYGFYIKSYPLWDPIRSDPRYSDLLKRCKLL